MKKHTVSSVPIKKEKDGSVTVGTTKVEQWSHWRYLWVFKVRPFFLRGKGLI